MLRPLVALLLASPALAGPPNVLLVMTDDQGYGDLGAHGNPILKTPNLDAFTKQSARLNRFYVCPVCSPTRASLMSGLYHFRTGVVDTYRGRSMMRPGIPTVAEYLAASGYRTGQFGKWHLGDHYPLRPEDRGFGETLWHHGGGLAQPSDFDLTQKDKYTDAPLMKNGQVTKPKGYCTDVFTDAALDFIRKEDAKPFFAYVAYNAPHGPFLVPDADAKPYRGIDLTAKAFPMVGQPWATPKLNTTEVANAYGMVANIDANFGRLLNALDDKKLANDTVVIFMTDNGPGGVRFNSGLRNRKGTTYDGGIRVPGYVRWPAAVKAGTVIDQPTAHIDIVPTLLDIAGAKPTKEVAFDGRSLLPLLTGKEKALPDRTLFLQWHRGDAPELFRGFAAVGPKYKLVQAAGTGEDAKWKPKFELFDIPADEFEQTDLAAKLPDEVAKLKAESEKWFKGVTKAGFDPVRIVVGSGKEPVTRLTPQDWRGPKAGFGAGTAGHWEITVAEAGKYEVTLTPTGAAFDSWEGGPDGKPALGQSTAAVRVAKAEFALTKGDTRLAFSVTSGKNTRAVDVVEVRRLPPGK